ncbi:hypothetical protein GCM10007907_28600 [Chitinimonas prasina]|uniref:Type II secretion system protein n=1 Tax=Chitinimonas prasina TaxID=1434937 RepID=A0ABQ5YGE7_9NEIS|nr:type II secretion system protein [Chitinimonas prasina]GLR14070.1 hypothetical protein GCM10007907_28600 [Chitinimonas prasina]
MQLNRNALRTLQSGFTLAEAATVLVIVALVLGGMLIGLPTQLENARLSEARTQSDNISAALVGYALRQEYLPCPDTNGDALEEPRAPATGACPSQEGWLPSATLGVNQADPWGSRVRYRVAPEFSNANTPITLATTAANPLQVCADQPCTTPLAQDVPAVWVMHGRNALGARNSHFTLNAATPATSDERDNANGRNLTDTADAACPAACRFIMHQPQDANPPTIPFAFDDIVNWLPLGILLSRMTEAGAIP